jgi:hypothetical protein
MLIFLDTNIFYNNYLLVSPSFSYLFNFVENTNEKLIISEVVVSEVDNLYNRELNKISQTINKELDKVKTFLPEKVSCDLESFRQPYSLKEGLETFATSVIYVPFDNVSHKLVVNRAINATRPFREGEKGYRDTMIWLSLLNYLQENDTREDVIFISKNHSDFFDKTTKELLPDLKSDIIDWNLHCSLKVFENLSDFINTIPDKTLYKFGKNEVYENYFCNVENDVEFETEFAINNFTTANFKNFLYKADSYFPRISTILNFSFEIVEGVEDPEIIKFKLLDEKSIYINAKYNLRICGMSITVPLSDYIVIKDQLNDSYEIDVENDEAKISYFHRIRFEVAYKYHIEKEIIDGFELIVVEPY